MQDPSQEKIKSVRERKELLPSKTVSISPMKEEKKEISDKVLQIMYPTSTFIIASINFSGNGRNEG